MLSDEEEIKERWTSYCKQLMNVENDRNERVVEPGEETAVEEIKEEEVAAATRRMKRGKAVGPNNIPVEAWRVLEWLGVEILIDMFEKIMETEKLPDEWSSTLIPIFKNEADIKECKNYRGIKLTSHTLKIWERIIDKRLREKVLISDQQFRFMPGGITMDAIFSLRQLTEKYREGQKSLHCIFIDLEKAYNLVPRSKVWNYPRLKSVAEKYICVIQDMCLDSRTRVKCIAGLTDDFQVTVGLHQGLKLSPLLFAIVMDCLTREIQRDAPWDMLFAGESREDLKTRLETWRRAMKDRGMRVSR